MSQSVIPTFQSNYHHSYPPKNSKPSCHINYHPQALTSVIMKGIERLVIAHIKSIMPDTLDPLQLAYFPNRTIYATISIALHSALSHLEKSSAYVRMLFIDYCSAFNTIVRSKVITRLGLNTHLCNLILDFLTC